MNKPLPIAELAVQRAGLLLSVAVVVSLAAVSLVSGNFGAVGQDSDDVMRLVQVRELLAGKGWFDLSQPRLGPEGGTLMHWSRLVDLPIAAITLLLTPVLGQEAALSAAISVWPLISVLIVIFAIIAGARALGGPVLVAFAVLLGFALLANHFRFLPGAIDHHNLQLGLLMIAVAGLLSHQGRVARYALAGAALGLAAAVGVEVYIFVAAIAGFAALEWALSGAAARQGAVAFGASFAGALLAAFLLTVGPRDYGVVHCDALSSVTLLAGAAGGAGFALAAQLASCRPLAVRLGALGVIALLCAIVVLLVGPQCLSNPLSALSPEARLLWLARVDEARPVLEDWPAKPANILYRLGPASLGLAAAAFLAWKGIHRREMLLFILLLTICVGFTFYQVRFFVFGQLFAVLPLAALAAAIRARETGLPRLLYLPVLLLGIPTSWAAAGIALTPKSDSSPADEIVLCLTPEAIAALKQLPPGRILASPNDTPGLLLETAHSALHGNYHRNTAGIDAAIAVFTAPPEAARDRLAAAGVDYVMVCPGDPNLRFFAGRAPAGLLGRIAAGEVPGWLEPAASAGDTVIYTLRPR